jgi:SAM-dependent methyltransferase
MADHQPRGDDAGGQGAHVVSAESDRFPPVALDQTRPSLARVYDAFLGGKDNYEVDREVCRRAIAIDPNAAEVPRDVRRWLMRVVRFLVEDAGVDQILDLGSGLPTSENVHQVAQRYRRTTVVYVDNDPMAAAYGRALLESDPDTHVVEGDLRRPAELLADPVVREHLDFDRPLAVIQSDTLHYVRASDRPAEFMQAYREALPPGSYLALNHLLAAGPGTPGEVVGRLGDNLRRAVGWVRCRSLEEIRSYFDGLTLVEPGLVALNEWRPIGPQGGRVADVQRFIIGAVGHKP